MRIKDERLREFKAVARLRGATMSTLVHQYLIEQIRKEKERDPTGFLNALKEVLTEDDKSAAALPAQPDPEEPEGQPEKGTLTELLPWSDRSSGRGGNN